MREADMNNDTVRYNVKTSILLEELACPLHLPLSLSLQDSESCSDPIDHELLRAADRQAQRSAYLFQGRDSQRFQLCGKRREVNAME